MLRACAVLLATAAALVSPARASACKCAPPASALDALHAAGAVFEGRVSKLTPLGGNDLVVELNVIRTWKAANSEHILLRTRQDSAACGFPFSPGESYLVYADAAPNDANMPGLEVTQCGRTKPMADAEPDIMELGMGVVPVSARQPEPATSSENGAIAEQRAKPAGAGCQRCSAFGAPVDAPSYASVVGALGLAAYWLLRRQRRQRRATL